MEKKIELKISRQKIFFISLRLKQINFLGLPDYILERLTVQLSNVQSFSILTSLPNGIYNTWAFQTKFK